MEEYVRIKMLIGNAMLIALMGTVAACGGETADDSASLSQPEPVESMEELVDDSADVVEDAMDEMDMEPEVNEMGLPMVDPLEVTGDIIIAGSSTVYPLAERMAERFNEEGYSGNVSVDSIGSGAGFERFCVAGETDISNASRAIKDEEVENCQSIGREPIEFRVGTDALAVVVSQENDFLEALTLEELALVFSTAETWADVNPDYPAEVIQRFSPGTDSGTYDYFVEEVFDEDAEPMLTANPQMSEDDNVLVQGIQGSPYAIGYFGYAYFDENQDSLKAISIEGVEPSQTSVDEGTYPLARPLYMYSTATIMAERPQVAAFLNFMLSTVNDEIIDVGYFPAPADAMDASVQDWLDAHDS
jgi:phosphate transport system substrate-binding protein